MDDLKTIGARIREARISRGLTQADLAAAVGVTRAHITKVEGGNDALALDKLAILARETGTTVGWLIGETMRELPPDPKRARLLAVYDALSDEGREIAVKVVEGLEARDAANAVVTSAPEPVPKSAAPRPKRRATACVVPVPLVRGR